MIQLINKLLVVLKDHVNQNKAEIQQNQEEIDFLLSNEHAVLKNEIDRKYDLNRELTSENSDFINMQNELKEFLERYQHLSPQSPAENLMNSVPGQDYADLFEKTVNGTFKFDSSHPQFNNRVFIRDLIRYYESLENYEMCNILLKLHS